MKRLLSDKGFTFIEIITSTVVMATIAAAVYGTALSTMKLTTFSRNEMEAHINANTWLEQVKTGQTSATRYNNLNNATWVDINNGSSILQEDYSSVWSLVSVPNVTNLLADYKIETIELGSGTPLKKVTVRVRWDED